MKTRNLSLRILLSLLAALPLIACSKAEKTVQWEEEVLLNTGEIIWIHRIDTFVKGSEPGNPLKMTWGIDKRTYKFSWQGQQYTYHTEPRTSLGAIRLHVYPVDKSIAVVDATKNCAKPGYGEFRWKNSEWKLQQAVDPALIGQARNLMASSPDGIGDVQEKITIAAKQQADTRPNSSKKTMVLDESKIAINCAGNK